MRIKNTIHRQVTFDFQYLYVFKGFWCEMGYGFVNLYTMSKLGL